MDGSPAVFRKRELLRVTFDAVAPRADQMTQRFFERLFAERPEFHAYFQRTRLTDLAPRLVQALGVIARSHDRPVAVQQFVANLGARHAGYGVDAADYPAFIEQLVAALGEHAGEEWDEQAEAAWREALESVTQTMVEAGRQAADLTSQTEESSADHETAPVTSAPRRRLPQTNTAGGNGEELAGFYQMIETAPVATLLVNPAGLVRYVNQSGQDLLNRLAAATGLSAGQIVNQPLQRLRRIAPKIVTAARSVKEPASLQAHVGQETVTVSLEPVFDAEGKWLGHCQYWVPATESPRHSAETSAATRQLLDHCAELIEEAATTLTVPESGESPDDNASAAGTQVEQLTQHAEAAKSSIDDFAAALDELDRTGLVAANVEQQSNLLALNANIEVARGYDPSESVSALAREAQELGTEAAELQSILTRQRESLREAVDGLTGLLETMRASLEELRGQVDQYTTGRPASATLPSAEWLLQLRESLQALRRTLGDDGRDTAEAAA